MSEDAPVPSPPAPGVRRILGIDPGTRVVGYGVVDLLGPARFEYVECGTLETRAREDVGARIHELCGHVAELLDELSPTDVAIEGAFHGLNAASALKLAESRGAYRELCMQRGLAPAEYPPAKVKRAVGGHGAAGKASMVQRVTMLFALEQPPKADAADALAIALCHAQHLMGPAAMGRFSR